MVADAQVGCDPVVKRRAERVKSLIKVRTDELEANLEKPESKSTHSLEQRSDDKRLQQHGCLTTSGEIRRANQHTFVFRMHGEGLDDGRRQRIEADEAREGLGELHGKQTPTPPRPSGTKRTAASWGSREARQFKVFVLTDGVPVLLYLVRVPNDVRGFSSPVLKLQRAFHAAVVRSLPPRVRGRRRIASCWGFFPLGFSISSPEPAKNPDHGFPNWMPPMFSPPTSAPASTATAAAAPSTRAPMEDRRPGMVDLSDGSASAGLAHVAGAPPSGLTTKKRVRSNGGNDDDDKAVYDIVEIPKATVLNLFTLGKSEATILLHVLGPV
ncbi:hypothetical protein Dimus_031602 [Dionaea muscipula]